MEKTNERLDEIREASVANMPIGETDLSKQVIYGLGFMDGGVWSDEHPDRRLVYTKKELMDMGFAFDLNGNICKMADYYDIMAVAPNKLRKKMWIEKACEYLKGLSYQEYPGGPIVRVLTDDMIEGFVKSVEE